LFVSNHLYVIYFASECSNT